MIDGAYASCRGTGLLAGRYACKDNDWDDQYICVADVRETARSFSIKLDIEASARLWLAMQGLDWEEFCELTHEQIIDQRRRHFQDWTPFKDGRLTIRKQGTNNPLYVLSGSSFLLNPHWGGTLYEFHRI